MASTINVLKPIKIIGSPVSSIDALYGPYNSINEALLAIPLNRRKKGRTIGIIKDNKVIEYWWESGLTDNDLVKKRSIDDILYFDTETPPDDTHKIWIDTDSKGSAVYSPDGLVASLVKRVETLESYVSKLLKIIEYGAIAGDASIGGRSLMEESATPINPITGEIEDPDEPTEKGVVTIPNFSPKIDTSVNFKKNMNNLIDGELIWIKNGENIKEGDLGLFLVANNKDFVGFIPCSSGTTPTSDLEVLLSDDIVIINGTGASIEDDIITINSSKVAIDSDNFITFTI